MLWFFITLTCIVIWAFLGFRAHGVIRSNDLRELIDTKEEASIVLGIVGVIVFLYGYLYLYDGFDYRALVSDFYANVAVDLLSILITVLVLDKLNERRIEQQEEVEKLHIIEQISSENNTFSLEAIKLADRNGWTTDGSLTEQDFSSANLESAYLANAKLSSTNFQNAFLYKANLSGADLKGANLDYADLTRASFRVADLRGASLKNVILDGTDFKGALYDSITTWPVGLDVEHIGAVTENVPIFEDFKLTRIQRELRFILAELYPEAIDARRVVADAGLESSFVDFQGSAQDIWGSILEEARLTQKIELILKVAKEDYPNYESLQAIWNEYQSIWFKH